MKQGLGSPYVKVSTSNGEISHPITDFTYKYSQEGDDRCQLTIEASKDDVTLPDQPEFQEGAILKVNWGYLGKKEEGGISTSREVVIRNIKAIYTESSISLDLLCTDKASRLKSTSSKKVYKGTVLDMAKVVTKDTGIKVIEVPEPTGISTGTNEQNIIGRMRDFDSFPQANKSDFNLLREVADHDPNGPFEIVGRDSNLYIQKRNTSQKPIKSYTYGDGTGELLRFTPETKNLTRQQGAINVNVNGFDPFNKTAFDINVNDITNELDKLGIVVDIPPSLEANGLGNIAGVPYILKIIPSGDGGNKLQVISLPDEGSSTSIVNSGNPSTSIGGNTEIRDEDDPINADPKNTFKKRPADKFGSNYAIKDTYGIVNFSTNDANSQVTNNLGDIDLPLPKVSTGTNEQDYTFRMRDADPLNYTQNIQSSENNVQDAYGKGANKQAVNSMKKNPATLEVLGDPILESGKILTLLRVSEKYSGNYYVEDCEHIIKPNQAYTVFMKLSRNGTGGVDPGTKVKAPITKFNSSGAIKKTTKVNKEVGPSETDRSGSDKPLPEFDSTSIKVDN